MKYEKSFFYAFYLYNLKFHSNKSKLSLNDITDTIEMVLLDFPDIDRIGISMPGIVNDGKLTLPRDGFNNTDIIGMLEHKYQKKVVLSNDINSVAVGYYVSQDTYSNICFFLDKTHRNLISRSISALL